MSKPSEIAYPHGADCVWLAADRLGHLGAFVTAGIAPIPVALLRSAIVPVEKIERLIRELPRVSAAQLVVLMERPDDFTNLAERGLFVYDWSDVHRSSSESIRKYELVAKPIPPQSVQILSKELYALAEAVSFEDVSFADHRSLDVCKHLECIKGE